MEENKIHLYNTLSRKIEEFKELRVGQVGIYSCGPTVYHYQHLGNMRAIIFADTVRRVFSSAGYAVKHIVNITDVGHIVDDADSGEDKMEKGAKREGKSVWEVAEYYTNDYFRCLDLLNIPRDKFLFPRATDNIKEQITLIETLEKKGFTYTISDGVYFDTSKFAQYPDLAKLATEGLKSGARVEENNEKRTITDFALWKFSPKNERRQMEWDSPWGKGFPGWHIECSAMAIKYLGNHFDIHTGGKEHVPVHHTNEIAQSECATDEKFVNYWLHYDWLSDSNGKMAKSSGDFLKLQTLIDKGYSPFAFRYYILTAHYRTEQSFSFEALTGAAAAYTKLYNQMAKWNALYKETKETPDRETLLSFYSALYDDIGTPKAIAILWTMLSQEAISDEVKYVTVLAMDQTLGLTLKKAQIESINIPKEIELLLEKRRIARLNKDFKTSDELRAEILTKGYVVTDNESGQEVQKI